MDKHFSISLSIKIDCWMKKIVTIFGLLLLYLSSLSAQEVIEGKRDSIKVSDERNIFELNTNSKTDGRHYIDMLDEQIKQPMSPEEKQRREEFVQTVTFQVPKLYVGPATQEKSWGKNIPNQNDYSFYNVTPVNEDLAMATSSTRTSYPMVMMNQVQLNLIYSINDWLTVSGGVYVAKYGMLQYQQDAGINASMRFKLNDRLYLKAQGRYSAAMHGSRNFGHVMEGMLPQTYYGGGLEYKINDKFGVEGGVIREFNPMTRKWSNRPYIGPIFY